jgi:hypothetical protein
VFKASQDDDGVIDYRPSHRCLNIDSRAFGSVVTRFSLATDLLEHTLQLVRKILCGLRAGPVLVDDTMSCGFERRGERGRGVGDIVIVQRLKILGRISRDKAAYQQQEPRLAIAQPLQRRSKRDEIPLLLALHHRRGVTARCRQISAVARTSNLDAALRAAAHGADVLTESRTPASSFASIA